MECVGKMRENGRLSFPKILLMTQFLKLQITKFARPVFDWLFSQETKISFLIHRKGLQIGDFGFKTSYFAGF